MGVTAKGTVFRLRRGTSAEHAVFTGKEGEVTYNTTTGNLHMHDGINPGGQPILGEKGTAPEHEWNLTTLRFQNSDGSWPVEWIDLKGDTGEQGIQGIQGEKGDTGDAGPAGPAPNTQWNGTTLEVQQSNGSWDTSGPDLQGPPGSITNLVQAVGFLQDPLYHLPLRNSTVPVVGVTTYDTEGTVYGLVRNGDATHIDRYGNVQDLAAGLPGMASEAGYDEDGIDLPCASTNLCLYSEDFLNAVWGGGGGAVTDGFLAPDGSLTAAKFTANGVLESHQIRQDIAVATGQPYTFSAFLKAGSLRYVLFYYHLGTGEYAYVPLDLETGELTDAAGGPSYASHTVEKCADGWVRVSITVTSVLYTTAIPRIFLKTTPEESTVNTAAGDIYIWGAQQEALPFPTPYIPTVGSSVLRSGSIVQLPYADNFPGVNSDVTILMDVTVKGLADTYANIFASGNFYINLNTMSVTDVTPYVELDNNTYALDATPLAASTFRIGVTYSPETQVLRVYIDGALRAEAAGVTGVHDPLDTLALNRQAKAYLKIKNIRIYDRYLTSTEMEIA